MGFGQKTTLQIFNRVEMGFVTTKKSQFTSKCESSAQSILHFFNSYFYLFGCTGSQLQHAGSLAAAFKHLVAACGIQFPDEGSNPGPLHWKGRVSATGPPGKCPYSVFEKTRKKQISFGVDVSLWQKMFYSRKTSCYCFWLVALKCSKYCNVLDAQGGREKVK